MKRTKKAPNAAALAVVFKDPAPIVVRRDAEVDADPEAGAIQVAKRSTYDGDTAIKLYLREIGQVKLLTREEEVVLAARIKKGDKKARQHMIEANLRLVVKIAHEYEGLGLPLLDLINEGNIGLMKAVDRFDPSKGGKMSTYGSWWIKQSIKRALANLSKTIRLPVHLVDKISKMRRVAMKLQEEFGREPTDDELGEELGITPARVAQLRSAALRPASLDAPAGDEVGSHSFGEVVEDENARNASEVFESKTLIEHMLRELKNLAPREREILRYRFGIDGEKHTLEETGEKFGVTRERVRQIQNIALRKLEAVLSEGHTTYRPPRKLIQPVPLYLELQESEEMAALVGEIQQARSLFQTSPGDRRDVSLRLGNALLRLMANLHGIKSDIIRGNTKQAEDVRSVTIHLMRSEGIAEGLVAEVLGTNVLKVRYWHGVICGLIKKGAWFHNQSLARLQKALR